MAVTCPENSTLGVCDILSETGTGIGAMVEPLALPLGKFLIILAVVGGVALLIGGVFLAIKNTVGRKKHL